MGKDFQTILVKPLSLQSKRGKWLVLATDK